MSDAAAEVARLAAIVDEHRRLMAESPGALFPVYADAQINLASRLAELGRHEEALAAAVEGVAHFQSLAATDSATFLVHLASGFNNLSSRLADSGRADDAQRAGAEAVHLSRQALAHQPEQARFLLVSALMNEAGRAWRANQALPALNAMGEAVTVFAEGGEALAGHLGVMIDALHKNAMALVEANRWPEAVAVRRMTVKCFGGPVPAPVHHLLALTLQQAAFAAAATGRPAEAVPLADEAVGLARSLLAHDPKYMLFLAQSLGNLASRLHEAGEQESALETAMEAVNMLQGVAETDASAAVAPLAVTLDTFAAILTALGHADQAETVRAQRAGLLDTMEKAKELARQRGDGEPR